MIRKTPETYLGYNRADSFNSIESANDDQTQNYTFPQNLPSNTWALQGSWNIGSQYIQSMSNTGSIEIHFNATNVYMVAGTANNTPIQVTVLLNGKPISTANSGADVHNGVLTLQAQTLYKVVSLPQAGSGTVTLQIQGSGAQLYTFTFG